ncbi:MAG: carboxypeptidase-like regulatory domain-containing protein, partial [Methanotrichaceae archaeon]
KYAANPNTDSIVSLMNELYTFSQNQKISLPTVTTDGGASAVISTAALLGAQITSTGGEKPDLHFCWDTSDHVKGSWPNNHDYGTEDIGPYYYDIFGLTPGTTYYYRCYATNSAGTGWSDYSSFITPVTVTITVKNAAGTAIPNAQIAVTDGGGNTKSATTNSNGQATITGVAGTWQYSVSATGYTTSTGSWQVTSSTTSESVSLQTAPTQATVTITVKNAAGTAIPSAQIAVTDGAGNSKSATTKSNGQATITGVAGTWSYSVSYTGFATSTGSWQVTSSTTSEVVKLQAGITPHKPLPLKPKPQRPKAG